MKIAPREVPQLTDADKARFWSKVEKSANPDGCWIWTAAKSIDGYGVFWCQNRNVRAHRISYSITGGIITDDRPIVIHGPCNNRGCVRPSHLMAGTYQDNMDDRKRDGTVRANSGETHGMAKLSELQISDIRQRYAKGRISQRVLADEFGVAPSNISQIVNRKRWAK